MGVPISQMATVASHVVRQKLKGNKRYPLVLMLEPLFRCNLACAGCGKIQHPKPVLKDQLTPQQCWNAAEECGAPMVALPGGEPLLHPQIGEIVAGLTDRGKYVYLCTNAILLEKKLDLFTPSKRLSFSVHIDGPREEHDEAVCREGVFDVAIEGIKAAIGRGFRVTTNTTVFNNADPARVREMFEQLTDLGVEGMMLSPGYPYEKAPDQEHFLVADETVRLFKTILADVKKRWTFNQSPLFLEFLRGNHALDCHAWGMPTYNLFGWQKPCYLMDEGYCDSYKELIASVEWANYGRASGNPKCTDCMVHSGYEAAAVDATFGSVGGLLKTARATLFGLPAGAPGDKTAHRPAPQSKPAGELVQLSV